MVGLGICGPKQYPRNLRYLYGKLVRAHGPWLEHRTNIPSNTSHRCLAVCFKSGLTDEFSVWGYVAQNSTSRIFDIFIVRSSKLGFLG